MKYLPLRIKFLLIAILPGLLIAGGISAAYYVLTIENAHRESRQRIEVAMAFLLDDFYQLATTYAEKLHEFSQNTTALGITADSYLTKPERIQSLPFIANYLMPLSDELRTFGNTITVDRLSLYAEDRRLLMFYQHGDEEDAIGAYVQTSEGNDTYLSLVDTSQRMMMSVGMYTIKDVPLPSGISAVYEGDMPEEVSVRPYNRGRQFGIRMLFPFFLDTQRKGILVGELFYSQRLIERYASLSQTELNMFGPDYFSVGTLSAQPPFAYETLQQMEDCHVFHQDKTALEISPLMIDEGAYYQGQCAFYAEGVPVGALTVSLSQEIEHQAVRKILFTIGSITVVTCLISFSLSYWLSRKPSRAITIIMQALNAVAEGDLQHTVRADSHDEFGQLASALNRTIAQLRGIVGQVQRSGIQVTSSATELAATAKEQEATAAIQVDSTIQVREAVSEISRVSAELARTMQQVAAMSQDAANFANTGQSDLLHMKKVMQRMETASSSIAGRLETINEKAENITHVVITITKVAEQTNLLSLNAAIEAEKAGEYGRGFTVVAREIRRLADQTAVATLDIEQMVKEMQTAVSAGVMEMDKFINEVRRSAEDVEKISRQLTMIIEQVQALSPNFDSVNVSMESQAENVQKINHAMLRLSEEMLQTKESVHETFSAIEHLHEATRLLEKEVSRFKTR